MIELAVYSCAGDRLIFMPLGSKPPIEAEATFGPLAFCGTASVDAEDRAWDLILVQVDRHRFATIPRLHAGLLAGIRLA